MSDQLTFEELRLLAKIKHRGFAVVVFTPEELRDADPKHVTDRLIEMGWDVIDTLATEPPEEPIPNAVLVSKDGDVINVYPYHDEDGNDVQSMSFWRSDYLHDSHWVEAAEKHAEHESKRTGLPVQCNY